MKINWKLLVSFLVIGVLSATIGVGVYSYLDNKNRVVIYDGSAFDQTGYHAVAYSGLAAENIDFTLAADQSIHAVVHIKSVTNRNQRYIDPIEFLFGFGNRGIQQYSQPVEGFGSGVIISRDGYVVTNNHVIQGADNIEVTTNDGTVYKASLIGGDEASDIALLKITGDDFPVIPFGNSDELKVGEWVLAVGNPFNLKSTVTAGIVSALGRGNIFGGDPRGRNSVQDKIQAFIQTDAAVNPGNSGGALVNAHGELVGINTAIYSQTGNFVGYSFAVPVNIVKKVVTDLKEYGQVQRAVLGILVSDLSSLKDVEPSEFEKLKTKDGVYVSDFPEKSSAQKAGVKKGDVITAINGVKVKNFTEMKAQLSLYNPGQTIDVEVNRYGDTKTFKIDLTNDQGTTEAIKSVKVSEILGIEMEELSKVKKDEFGIDFGVKITSVANGKFKNVGINKDFIILTINQTKVYTPNDVENIAKSVLKQDPDDRALFIRGCYDNGKIQYFAVDLNN